MTRKLYNDIKTRLEAQLLLKENDPSGVAWIDMWNDQFSRITDEKKDEEFIFDFPAIFLEFNPPNEINSIGNNVQVFDPLDIRVHIIYHQFDGGVDTLDPAITAGSNSRMSNNLAVLDFKQKVYLSLQLFKPDGCSVFVRQGEEQDLNHSNLYHFIQTYRCCYMDYSGQLPVGGIDKNPPTNFDNTVQIVPNL